MGLRSCLCFMQQIYKIIYRKQNPLLSHQYTHTIQIIQLSLLKHYWITHHTHKNGNKLADKNTAPQHLLVILPHL